MDIKDFVILVQSRLIAAHSNIDYYGKFPENHERNRRLAYHTGARDALTGILETLQEENDET